MNKIEIEIPEGQEIDWKESAKQEKIVFKRIPLTYKNVCEKLFDKGHYCTDSDGDIHFIRKITQCPNNATSEHQLKCLLAKNKLANVARYLNGELSKKDFQNSEKYILWADCENNLFVSNINNAMTDHGYIIFISLELAQQAIEILGEETVKLALTPLY